MALLTGVSRLVGCVRRWNMPVGFENSCSCRFFDLLVGEIFEIGSTFSESERFEVS
jgi:hypothetical protein